MSEPTHTKPAVAAEKTGHGKQTTGTDKKEEEESEDDDDKKGKHTRRRTFLRHRLQSRDRKTFGPENLPRAHPRKSGAKKINCS